VSWATGACTTGPEGHKFLFLGGDWGVVSAILWGAVEERIYARKNTSHMHDRWCLDIGRWNPEIEPKNLVDGAVKI